MLTNIDAIVEVVARRVIHRRTEGWSQEERKFLEENLGKMSVEQIGYALGRSANAVKIKQFRYGFKAGSKQKGWLTGRQASKALGVDIHCIMHLVERGMLPCERIPGPRHILRIRQVTLYRWATRPEHWMMFKTAKMGDRHLARLVELAKARWGDEWWSIGRMARERGVDIRNIAAHIYRGRLKGVQWGNWYIRKSVAMKEKFYEGKGGAAISLRDWPARADAFILKCRAEGKMWKEIARMMRSKRYHWTPALVAYRHRKLLNVD